MTKYMRQLKSQRAKRQYIASSRLSALQCIWDTKLTTEMHFNLFPRLLMILLLIVRACLLHCLTCTHAYFFGQQEIIASMNIIQTNGTFTHINIKQCKHKYSPRSCHQRSLLVSTHNRDQSWQEPDAYTLKPVPINPKIPTAFTLWHLCRRTHSGKHGDATCHG